MEKTVRTDGGKSDGRQPNRADQTQAANCPMCGYLVVPIVYGVLVAYAVAAAELELMVLGACFSFERYWACSGREGHA